MSTKIGTATTYANLIELLDAFLCDQGHAWGLTFTGVGNGRMRGPGGTTGGYLGTATTVTETITATFTSATAFDVSGTVSGALGSGTVGVDFTSSVITFRIVAGGTAFVAGDQFLVNTGPKWTRMRLGGCIESTYRSASFAGHETLFDGVWNSGTGVTISTFPATLNVEMFKPTEVRSFAIAIANLTTTTPAAFSIDWSDDGSSWTTAQSWSGQTWTLTFQRRDYVLSSAPGAHRYWRIRFTASNGANALIRQVRLFGDAAGKWDVSSRFEFAWKAPGVDGAQEIITAGYTATNTGADSYNIGFRSFRYWLDPDLSVMDVPNASGAKFLLLSKTPTAYWLVANGGRVIVATRTSSVYQFAYSGFGLPYETPAVHTFPMLCGATHTVSTKRWDAANEGGYRNPCDPGADSSTDGSDGSLAAMMPDGSWLQCANRYTSGSASDGAAAAGTRGRTWPYSGGTDGSPLSDHLRDCVDGTKPLLPIMIFKPTAPIHPWGEFDGIYWTTGFANTAESVIVDGAIDHLSFPNVNRSAINAFAAIALD